MSSMFPFIHMGSPLPTSSPAPWTSCDSSWADVDLDLVSVRLTFSSLIISGVDHNHYQHLMTCDLRLVVGVEFNLCLFGRDCWTNENSWGWVEWFPTTSMFIYTVVPTFSTACSLHFISLPAMSGSATKLWHLRNRITWANKDITATSGLLMHSKGDTSCRQLNKHWDWDLWHEKHVRRLHRSLSLVWCIACWCICYIGQ